VRLKSTQARFLHHLSYCCSPEDHRLPHRSKSSKSVIKCNKSSIDDAKIKSTFSKLFTIPQGGWTLLPPAHQRLTKQNAGRWPQSREPEHGWPERPSSKQCEAWLWLLRGRSNALQLGVERAITAP
jgi:hypothetical protein